MRTAAEKSVDLALNHNISLLYEFIYGSKQHEFGTLMEGLAIAFDRAKSIAERLVYRQLFELSKKAWVASRREKWNRFKQRMKAPFPETLKKAQSGDDRALFMLVAFDKGWLFAPFSQKRILLAESEGDQKFLHLLGEAVKRVQGSVEDVRGKRDAKQLLMRRLFRQLKMVGYDFSGSVKNDLLKIVDDFRGKLPLPMPETPDVIERTIRRMGLKA